MVVVASFIGSALAVSFKLGKQDAKLDQAVEACRGMRKSIDGHGQRITQIEGEIKAGGKRLDRIETAINGQLRQR